MIAPADIAAARAFARDWVAAWNSHDLDRILSHYAEDVEFRSPFVVALTGVTVLTLLRREARLRCATTGARRWRASPI